MLEKLKAIEERLTEVERQLSDPAVYADRERLTALSREQKELTPVVACYRAYAQAVQTAEDAAAMLSDPEPGGTTRLQAVRGGAGEAERRHRRHPQKSGGHRRPQR